MEAKKQNKICSTCKNDLDLSLFNKNKSKKDGFNNQCKSCSSKYKYSIEYKRKYYQKDRKTNRKSNNKYYLNNKDKILEDNRKYYNKNKDKIKAKQKEWRNNNKLSILAKNSNRRAKLKGKISAQEIRELIDKSNGICYYCKCVIGKMHLDHFIPLCKDGEHKISNIVVSCDKCNLQKGTKFPEDFLKILNKILLSRNIIQNNK